MNFLRITALLAIFAFPVFAEVSEIVFENGKISASFTSQPLRQTVQIISKQTGVHIAIDDAVADESVSANFKDLPLAVGIKKLLEGTGINYAVIAGADGIPSAVLISGSEKPGAPPKKLDTRPTSAPANYQNRSVVTPVNPPPPQQNPQPVTNVKQPGQTGTSVGGVPNPNANPNPNQPQQQQPVQPSIPKFDPNNIPTAGSLVPNVTPTQPPPDGKTDPRTVVNQNDEDEDEEE